jgi:hypothetical protein
MDLSGRKDLQEERDLMAHKEMVAKVDRAAHLGLQGNLDYRDKYQYDGGKTRVHSAASDNR